MPEEKAVRGSVRFGRFELSADTGELRKDGVRMKVSGQAIQVLAMLVPNPGKLVTREELQQKLWPGSSYGDPEHGLNAAISKLRETLGDSATEPKYIETVPGRGYRFTAQVEAVRNGGGAFVAEPASVIGSSVLVLDELAPPRSLEPPPSRPVIPPPKPKRWKYPAAAVLLFAIVAGALYGVYRPRTPVVTGIRQLTHTGLHKTFVTYHQLLTDGTRVYFDEWDGRVSYIAQVSTKGGEVSHLDTSPMQQPGTAGISSDGSELLLVSIAWNTENQFWVFQLPNGPVRKLPGLFQWMQYLPANDRYVYVHDGQLFTENRDSTDARRLMPLPKGFSLYSGNFSFSISPDGKRTRFSTGGDKMWESRLDGTGLHRFLPEHKELMCCGIWSPDGNTFVFASEDVERDNLWAVTERGFPFYKLVSNPIQLTNGPLPFRFSTFAKAGNQIFAMGETKRGELSAYDAQSGQFSPDLNGISAGYVDFSRDGRWVIYVTYPEGTLWRSRVDGSERIQLTPPSTGVILLPRWSPDGRFIVFMSWDNTFLERKIYMIPADGGAPLLLLSGGFQPSDPTWSPDSKSIAYGGSDRTGSTEIRILSLETKESHSIPGSRGMYSPRWSPDGRYIVAESSDQQKLLLYSFQTGQWKELPSLPIPPAEGLGYPAWSHDSRYVYTFCDGKVFRIRVPDGSPEAVASFGDMQALSPLPHDCCWLGLTPDDRLLVLRDRGFDELYALDLEYR
jgi:DNA-binding winged helix-turn-helix (wHTH) protein/Tol biopolymer transport system component